MLGQRLMPAVLDRYLARTGYTSQQTGQPRRPGPVRQPVGAARRRARHRPRRPRHPSTTGRSRRSPQLWLSRHARSLSIAAARSGSDRRWCRTDASPELTHHHFEGDDMSDTVGDVLLARLAGLGRRPGLRVSPATASTGCSRRGNAPTTTRSSSRPATRRWPRSRPWASPSSPARSACAWPPAGRGRCTCSTGCTTPNSTTCRWWRSSGRPNARRWAAPTSRRSTCSACSRTSAVTTCRCAPCPSNCPT